MAIDLLSLTPHKISRDLSGYMVYVYGSPGCGKTTLCSEFPDVLLLATEKGWNAIGGIIVQPITTWGEMKQTINQLKKPEVKERFKTIAIDTVN